jgi:hypothetical protein
MERTPLLGEPKVVHMKLKMARTSLTAAHMKPVQDQLLELWPRTDSEAVVRAVPVRPAAVRQVAA